MNIPRRLSFQLSRRLTGTLLAFALAFPAAVNAAEGDAAEGARVFARCTACHAVVAGNGRVLVAGGRAGPNLYGIAGARAGRVVGFKYSDALRAAGAQGLTWTEDSFAEYLVNPTEYLKAWLGDDSVRGSMAFRMKDHAADLWAYLRSLDP